MPTQSFKVGEMLNKRKPNAKTWMNFDGSYTTEIYNGIVHFEDENGNLQNINTDLFDEADADSYDLPVSLHGKAMMEHEAAKVKVSKKADKMNREDFDYQVPGVPFSAQLPKNIIKGYSIGKSGSFVRFVPQKASPSRGYITEKNRAHYQDAWNDADIILDVLGTGIKETIILKTDRAPNAFSFEVTDGIINDDLTLNGMELQAAWLQDASGVKRDVEQTIRREGTKTYIDLVADVEGLIYPIEIDPTVTIQPDGTTGKDTYVQSSAPTSNYSTSTSLPVINNGSITQNSLIQFDISSIPIGSRVTDASLTLILTSWSSGATTPVNVKRVTSSWETSITWNTMPTFDNTAIATLNIGVSSTQVFNITTLVDNWLNSIYPNYGLLLDTQSNLDSKTFASSNYTENSSYKPKLSITYNAPPTTPIVATPNGGETWNSLHTVTWSGSTDPEGLTNIQYQIQLSTDNGATWKDVVALTTQNVTSYEYDFINETQSSTCLIRIRSYDGFVYGFWDQSDGVFTILHNTAPTAPTNLSPIGSIDRALIQRLSWQHNDPQNDVQSKFDLQWRLQGDSTWNTVTQTTTNNYWDAPINTFSLGSIEWQIRTYDQEGLSGPYSSLSVFNATNKPATPTITAPTNNATIPIPRPVIQWSHPGQVEYHLKVMDAPGTGLVWEEQKTSTNKAVTVGINLSNNTTYQVKVSVRDSGGLWSDFATVTINVSYTPPGFPILSATKDDVLGIVNLTIDNPVPIGTEPSIAYNDIYRRENGGEWIRIAENLPNDANFSDYEAKPVAMLEYYAIAYGESGAYIASDIISITVNIAHTQILLVSNPAQYATLHKGTKLSKKNKIDSEKLKFVGRPYALTFFGTEKEQDFDYKYLVFDFTDLQMMEFLSEVGETLLLRDSIGRKEYVTIDGLSIEETPTHWEVSVQPSKVYYVEGV